ncbi:hypothetical protein IGI04_040575 [Brassica rapa subsp. trilocularis]|uniref:Uncharacterized protein n=1 Tax=Brassica rapa subsp. trilocularis TaxID=1813537 RepID=A0ABQ7KP28_BRACM|nr:hypothetical protein IGI04_040575 [Brassica rapa subsp. trilocularis]
MEGSPYRKFFISWKGARFQGPNSGFLLEGDLESSLIGDPRVWVLQLPRSAYRWKIIGRHWEPILELILLLRKIPLDRRQVNFLVSLTILLHSSLWRNMFGSAINDPFAAY